MSNDKSVLESASCSLGDALDERELGPYEIYVLSDAFKEGLGIALVDTGVQISIVNVESLRHSGSLKGDTMRITGITGDSIEVRCVQQIGINDSKEFPFRVVDRLPQNLTWTG
jgi:hypothetical protein